MTQPALAVTVLIVAVKAIIVAITPTFCSCRATVCAIVISTGAPMAMAKSWVSVVPFRCSFFHVHFTPTSASWLNMVERFFRSISTDRLERGVFRSVPELIAAINEYIAAHNRNPKPFIWTAKANDILQKVIRANAQLGSKNNEALHHTLLFWWCDTAIIAPQHRSRWHNLRFDKRGNRP